MLGYHPNLNYALLRGLRGTSDPLFMVVYPIGGDFVRIYEKKTGNYFLLSTLLGVNKNVKIGNSVFF